MTEDGGRVGLEPNKERVKKHGPLPIYSFTEVSNKIITLKGPKHDQIECGFFYINPTSMGW